MAGINEETKKVDDQRIEIIKALTHDFDKIKQEQVFLVQRYHELFIDYANATNSVTPSFLDC